MINVHLNGDIVRCPDIAMSKHRLQHIRNCEGKCRFGIKESECKTRAAYNLRYRIFNKRCECDKIYCRDYTESKDSAGFLWRQYVCPLMQRQYINSLKSKKFCISNDVYRKMASAAHDLIKSSPHKSIFITLTFPKFKIEPNEKQVNECFSRFVENLRTNYDCMGYIGVREYGETTNRVHFHLLLSMPWRSFVDLNRAWCRSISDYCDFSPCALRTTKKSLYIKSPVWALRYVCKYFSKTKYTKSDTKLVFMSNNLIKKPVILKNINPLDILQGYKGVYIQQTSDYSTCFRVTDPDEFTRFCNSFLYETFEKAYNYPLFNKKTTSFYVPAPD